MCQCLATNVSKARIQLHSHDFLRECESCVPTYSALTGLALATSSRHVLTYENYYSESNVVAAGQGPAARATGRAGR